LLKVEIHATASQLAVADLRGQPPHVGEPLPVSTATERATIERAARALLEAVAVPSTVILFGPHARGDADNGSDYHFLIIEEEVDDCFGEMARLGRILGGLLIPADVVVISRQQAKDRELVKGTLIHEALTEGRVVAES
jgi:predicted nucleotidyltransferase